MPALSSADPRGLHSRVPDGHEGRLEEGIGHLPKAVRGMRGIHIPGQNRGRFRGRGEGVFHVRSFSCES